ncbi:MAG: BolA/IbaG family iron-sulfur metabolism protein [Solirubrobacterales bacterium]
MADLAELEAMIAAALPGAEVEVIDETGAGDHLRATVSAPQFEGLSRLDQHRLVKAAVSERFEDGQIHALSVRTALPPPSSAPAPAQESDRDAPPLPRSEEGG